MRYVCVCVTCVYALCWLENEMQTDAKNPNFYPDSLRACLIAAVSDPESYKVAITYG